MKISKLFEGQKSMCREMLWNAGLVWLVIDKVETRKCFLPGTNEEKPEKHLCFRGIDAGIVVKGGKLKFLIRELGGNDTAEWAGKRIGLYVDRAYKDRKGSGYGSIQFVVGDQCSGKSRPPTAPAKSDDVPPLRVSGPLEQDPTAYGSDGPPPEAIDQTETVDADGVVEGVNPNG